MNRLFLSPPYIGGNERSYVQEVFDTNWIAPLGPQVTAFEREMAAYVGAPYAVAVSSGTAAIHLALRWLEVGEGDFVFCSAFTFAGSCNPILYQNAQPVFIDSEPDTLNMSPQALRNALEWAQKQGKLPKAVIIVDLYGQSADYDKLLPLCDEYGIPVVEDAAEALGASYNSKMCGTMGDVGIFSFNGNKIVTTSGGGMIVTHNAAAAEKMLYWATQAKEKTWHYEHMDYGYNYRLSNVCAAIGRGQLEMLPHKIARRRQIQERYRKLLAGMPIRLHIPYQQSNYWLSLAILDADAEVTPEQLCVALDQVGIEARPAWKPMHLQPVFKGCPFFAHEGDVSADIFSRGLCLPTGEALTEEQQERVTKIIRDILTAR